MKTVYPDENKVVLDENRAERKPCINRESKSLELTIQLYSCHDINMKFLVVEILIFTMNIQISLYISVYVTLDG